MAETESSASITSSDLQSRHAGSAEAQGPDPDELVAVVARSFELVPLRSRSQPAFLRSAHCALEEAWRDSPNGDAEARRRALYEALRHPLMPLLRLDRLAEVLRQFVRLIESNSETLLAIGWPAWTFTRALWLQGRAGPLYPTKMPAAAFTDRLEDGGADFALSEHEVWQLAEQDALPRGLDGQVVHHYCWSREGPSVLNYPAGDLCSYRDAPLMPRLAAASVHRLEQLRPRVLRLRVSVLRACADALDNKSEQDLWPTVRGLLGEELSSEELELLLGTDAWYEEREILYNWARMCGWEPAWFPNGGLTDLLRIVGHCAKEIRLRTMDHARRDLDALEEDAVGLTLAETGALQRLHARFDALVLNVEEARQEESEFWRGFVEGLNADLGHDFGTSEMKLTYRVPKDQADAFRRLVDSHAGFQLASLELTGGFAQLAGALQSHGRALTVSRGGDEEPVDTAPPPTRIDQLHSQLDQTSSARPAPNEEPKVNTPPPYLLERTTLGWRIVFEGHECECGPLYGLSWMALLLARPGELFSQIELDRSFRLPPDADAINCVSKADDGYAGHVPERVRRIRDQEEGRADAALWLENIEKLQKKEQEARAKGNHQQSREFGEQIRNLRRVYNSEYDNRGRARDKGEQEQARRRLVSNKTEVVKALTPICPKLAVHLHHFIKTRRGYYRYWPLLPIKWVVRVPN